MLPSHYLASFSVPYFTNFKASYCIDLRASCRSRATSKLIPSVLVLGGLSVMIIAWFLDLFSARGLRRGSKSSQSLKSIHKWLLFSQRLTLVTTQGPLTENKKHQGGSAAKRKNYRLGIEPTTCQGGNHWATELCALCGTVSRVHGTGITFQLTYVQYDRYLVGYILMHCIVQYIHSTMP